MEQTYITVEDFNKYTEYVKEKFKGIEERVNESASPVGPETAKFEKLIEYANKISESVNEMAERIESLEEGYDKAVVYSNYQTTEMNALKEALEDLTGYTKHVAEMADKGIQFSDKLAEDVDGVLEKVIGYVGHVAEMSDKGIQFSDRLAEDVDSMLDKIVKYTAHLKEGIENSILYTEHVVNEINTEYEKALNEKRGVFAPAVNESAGGDIEEDAKDYKGALTESIDALVKAAESKATSNLTFMNFLSESKKREFSALGDEAKERVISRMNEGQVMSTVDAHRIWESCFIAEDKAPDFISDMPEKYKSKWNALSEGRKAQIIAESKFYPLTNAYQINNFWSTRDLREKQVVMEKLVESAAPVTESADSLKSIYEVDADRRAEIVNRLKFNLGR